MSQPSQSDAAEMDWLTLDDGEEVVWSGKPHKSSLVPALIVGSEVGCHEWWTRADCEVLAWGSGLRIARRPTACSLPGFRCPAGAAR